jgi:hypothetical protein
MAQTSVQIENNTVAAGNLVDDFFEVIPSDQRYTRIGYQKFQPTVLLSGTSDCTTFELRKMDYPNCYQLNEALVSAKVRFTTHDKVTVVDKSKLLAPINNCLHSLIKSCELRINQTAINLPNTDYYFMKAYMFNLFTFNHDVKNTGWLQDTTGFAADVSVEWNSVNNTSFVGRNLLFRKERNANGDYAQEGAHFVGKLFHELANCDKLIPPTTTVTINLSRTSDGLYIQHYITGDSEKYAVQILELDLYVPIVILAEPLSKELKFKWEKMPITYNFRTYKTVQFSISNGLSWMSPALFNAGEHPIRVFLAIVPNEAMVGTYNTSPFEFKRKFKYTTASSSEFSYQHIRGHEDISNAMIEVKNQLFKDQAEAAKKQQESNKQIQSELAKMAKVQQAILESIVLSQPSTSSAGSEDQMTTRSQAQKMSVLDTIRSLIIPDTTPPIRESTTHGSTEQTFDPASQNDTTGSHSGEVDAPEDPPLLDDDPIPPPSGPVMATEYLSLRKMILTQLNTPVGNVEVVHYSKVYQIIYCNNCLR